MIVMMLMTMSTVHLLFGAGLAGGGGSQQAQHRAQGIQQAQQPLAAVEDVEHRAEVDGRAQEQRHVLARGIIPARQQRQRPLHQLLQHRRRQRALHSRGHAHHLLHVPHDLHLHRGTE
jgi:hypothetical protein